MFQLNSPMDLAAINDLYVEGISFDALVIENADYGVFCQTRLAPHVVCHEIRTHVALPDARVRVVDLKGQEAFEDIPMLPDPVDGLPFPPDFKGERLKLLERLTDPLAYLPQHFADIWKVIKGERPVRYWRDFMDHSFCMR